MKTWRRMLLFSELAALAVFLFTSVPTQLSASDPGQVEVQSIGSNAFGTRYLGVPLSNSSDASMPMLPGMRRIDGHQVSNGVMNSSTSTLPFQVFVPLTLAPSNGYSTILQEGFEGEFTSPWVVFDSYRRYGEMWDKRDCRPYSGSYSAWIMGRSVVGGTVPAGCGSSYDYFMDVWMVYGPFSLAEATRADLRYKMWLYSEVARDYLCQLASIDGTNYGGVCFSGFGGGWGDVYFDLTDVPYVGNATGKPNVWIAFNFTSNARNNLSTYPEGAYVDDVVIRRCSSNCVSPSAATHLLPGTGTKRIYKSLSLAK